MIRNVGLGMTVVGMVVAATEVAVAVALGVVVFVDVCVIVIVIVIVDVDVGVSDGTIGCVGEKLPALVVGAVVVGARVGVLECACSEGCSVPSPFRSHTSTPPTQSATTSTITISLRGTV